ncbi:MAG: lipoate--protein ligase [Anaerolineaceae bacterium]|jgi:lipoate-protein ligase A
MWFVDSQDSALPQVNLAIEEYLLRNILPEEDLLLLYVNEPSIIIGRFQNTLEEVNQTYVDDHGIHVVRRLSGGGAVYHDLNNLNYSFITAKDSESISNFKKFTAPVIRILNEMGVPAELGARNEIHIRGLKISGSAQYITTRRMISHGTLLFNSDLTRLSEALLVAPGQISSKSIKSIRSQVTNIADHLPQPMDMAEFRQRILQGITQNLPQVQPYHLTESDWQAIRRLAEERYMQWQWNYGGSPDFSVKRNRRFAGKDITIQLDIHQGAIRSANFSAGFLEDTDRMLLSASLAGVRYTREQIRVALAPAISRLQTNQLSITDWLELLI